MFTNFSGVNILTQAEFLVAQLPDSVTQWTIAHQTSMLPEFAQSHVHGIGDAIQPSHPLSSPSPLALDLSQHQGLFQYVSSSHLVAKLLEFQHQSFK